MSSLRTSEAASPDDEKDPWPCVLRVWAEGVREVGQVATAEIQRVVDPRR
jgi:hypothetical protein